MNTNSGTFDVPILLIIYKRARYAEQLFSVVKKIRPSKLYIAADGPNAEKPDDQERVEEARAVVEQVDWPCQVIKLYRETNVGVKKGVSSAISWLFEYEEKGIILEEDCVPSLSFFPYCDELLKRYAHNNTVMQISGVNLLEEHTADFKESYYFSTFAVNWGWATWKRAWEKYDINLSIWLEYKNHPDFAYLYDRRSTDSYFKWRWQTIADGDFVSCMLQWDFARKVHSGLNIVPTVNLIRNIGFGDDASHEEFKKTVYWIENFKNNEIELPLIHKHYLLRNTQLDRMYEDKYFRRPWYIKIYRNYLKLRNKGLVPNMG
jgi:hypothetical protein